MVRILSDVFDDLMVNFILALIPVIFLFIYSFKMVSKQKYITMFTSLLQILCLSIPLFFNRSSDYIFFVTCVLSPLCVFSCTLQVLLKTFTKSVVILSALCYLISGLFALFYGIQMMR